MARSRLFLQKKKKLVARWKALRKALDEIYKIYMLLHRSDLNIHYISANFRQTFWRFQVTTLEMQKSLQFFQISSRHSLILMKFDRIFSDFVENAEKRCNFSKFLDFNLIFILIVAEIYLIAI